MKLERLFEVRDSKLYKIGEDAEYKPDVRSVKWSEVEGNPEEYNEEFLAKLRDELKALEANGKFVLIEPAMKHTARRIKDCVSVIGFSIPDEISGDAEKSFYIEEMSAKHKQFCFFSKKALGSDIAKY